MLKASPQPTALIHTGKKACLRCRPSNSRNTPGPFTFYVKVVRSPQELHQHAAALDNLTSAALEPNVFYESWMLLPAMEAFGSGVPLEVMLVYRQAPASEQVSSLCGLLPLERRPSWRRVPLSVLRLWRHAHCVLGTPLLRESCATECWEFFLRWLASESQGCRLLELPYVTGDGPFNQLLIHTGNRLGIVSEAVESTVRALYRPRASAKVYLDAALSSKRRQELRRLERRLREVGPLEFRHLDRGRNCAEWIEAFLTLEAKGWKGAERTALVQETSNRQFFRAFVQEAFARDRLMMLGAFVNDKPIALKCNLMAGEGSYAFKIAYDEQYAKYSPGVLLELYNISHLHEMGNLAWMDSCAIPDHPMINQLWLDRRTIQTVLISCGSAAGDLLVSLVPVMRWLKRRLIRTRASSSENPCSKSE
jgi:CelD/BcsL family acetyltransferase involved in cellulose biosynthesis